MYWYYLELETYRKDSQPKKPTWRKRKDHVATSNPFLLTLAVTVPGNKIEKLSIIKKEWIRSQHQASWRIDEHIYLKCAYEKKIETSVNTAFSMVV